MNRNNNSNNKYFSTINSSSGLSTISSVSSIGSSLAAAAGGSAGVGMPPPYMKRPVINNSNADTQSITTLGTLSSVSSNASTVVNSSASTISQPSSVNTMPGTVVAINQPNASPALSASSRLLPTSGGGGGSARDTISIKTAGTGGGGGGAGGATHTEKYLGYADLPNQVYRRAVKKGFDFNLMLLGESGVGKATFINTFFTTDVYDDENFPGPSHRFNLIKNQNKNSGDAVNHDAALEIHTSKLVMTESGVSLRLAVVDVPGYGDLVDNSDCWKPVSSYVDRQYFEYLAAEMELNRDINHRDNRIHCLLYFIQPGHGLKPLDIMTMKRLHEKVNIVPVISKADTLTPEETIQLKKKIMTQITDNDIQIYDFPDRTFDNNDGDNDEAARAHAVNNQQDHDLRQKLPFAVVGSNECITVNGKQVRGRKYPWGNVVVDDPLHCDTSALRSLLLGSHLDDLIEVTNNVHYENYRRTVLMKWIGISEAEMEQTPALSLFGLVVERKARHENKMKRMKEEMERVFETKVQEKLQKLENNENEMRRETERMRGELARGEQDVAKMEERLEHEKNELCELYPHLADSVRRGGGTMMMPLSSASSIGGGGNAGGHHPSVLMSHMSNGDRTDAGGGGNVAPTKKEKKKLGLF